jgi:hypothetical protein
MKSFLLSLGLLIFLFSNFIQAQYPLVTIEDIQYLPDSILINFGDQPSPLNGQTAKVRGVVMVSPLVNPQTDRRPIMWAGARWVTYLYDPDGQVYDRFDGLNVLQMDTSVQYQGTFFDLIDTAQVIEVTFKVNEYLTTTQGEVLLTPVTPVSIIQQLPKRPDPIELNVSDFMSGGSMNPLAERYEGEYVIIKNVITSNRNTSDGTFRVNDLQGNYIFMYDQSGYFTKRGHRLTGLTTYEPPVDGSTLSYIRGAIQTWSTGYRITPMYPGDIGQVLVTPLYISNLRRNLAHVLKNQAVTVTVNIEDFDGSVDSAKLFYRVDSGSYNSVNMSLVTGTKYTANIPGINSDSALVDYYIWAKDNEGNTSTFPAIISNVQYFYIVLNRDITIQDVQYNPFGSDVSGYSRYRVPLTGIITADTSDYPGTGITVLKVYMQNGQGPWSGIQIGTRGPNGNLVRGLLKGHKVTVNGLIWDEPVTPTFNVTRIDSTTNVTVLSTGNPVPTPELLQTSVIGTGGFGQVGKEAWESVLLRYENVIVTNENPDFPNNYSEMMVSDGSGDTRVELGDGRHSYHNLGDPTRPIYVKTGSSFDAVQGILYYSFGDYKLVPRNDNDFIGYTPASVEREDIIPTEFSLSQNYPNPFNPVTTIKFAVPEESTVRLTVYNILGQEVKVLIDNEVQQTGAYIYTFDAQDWTSGIYFYRLTASPLQKGSGNFVDVKKMILLK